MCTFGFFSLRAGYFWKAEQCKNGEGVFFFLVIGAVFSFGVMLCGFLFFFFFLVFSLSFT